MQDSAKVPGFRSGFRQGLGFMVAIAVVNGGLFLAFVLAAWLTYGSVRNLVVANVRDVIVASGGVGRAVADGAKAGVGRAKDAAVEGATGAARRVGEGVRGAGEAVRGKVAETGDKAGEKAGEAKEAVRAGFGGLVGRFRSKPTEQAGATGAADPQAGTQKAAEQHKADAEVPHETPATEAGR